MESPGTTVPNLRPSGSKWPVTRDLGQALEGNKSPRVRT